jgi:hypothetical protein
MFFFVSTGFFCFCFCWCSFGFFFLTEQNRTYRTLRIRPPVTSHHGRVLPAQGCFRGICGERIRQVTNGRRRCRPPPPLRVYMLSYIRCLRRGTSRHYKYRETQPNSCPRLFVSRRLFHRPPAYLPSTWSTPTTPLYPVGTVIRDVLRSILLDPVLCGCSLSGGPGVGQPQDD